MSIQGDFIQIKRALEAGGNFGFIAQNIACIYYAIGLTDFGKNLTEEERLFATGILDTIAYINEGSITYEDIKREIPLAQIGELGMFPYSTRHRTILSNEENANLVAYAMCIELLLFEIENSIHVDYPSLVQLVIGKKPEISKMVNKTLEEGSDCILFNDIMMRTIPACSSPQFQEIVKSYKKEGI